jgi:hypothetical protein
MNGGKTEDGMRRLTGPGSDASGQMSIDFLFGVVIFLMTFIFVFTFISGMLTPFQSNSDELTMMADRIGTECVEKLMVDSYATPNIINGSKIQDMINSLNDPNPSTYRDYCKDIGAYSNQHYNVNITITMSDNSIKNGGPEYPTGSLNVGQSKRVVGDKTGKIGILYVTVW